MFSSPYLLVRSNKHQSHLEIMELEANSLRYFIILYHRLHNMSHHRDHHKPQQTTHVPAMYLKGLQNTSEIYTPSTKA